MNSHDIRKKFQAYFTNQGHTWVPSSSLIPKGDSSLLFTNAGMNQFKDYFLGLKPPPAEQVCSIQKCLRAGGKHNDLEEVGHSPYHHTFFEMIGFFSFGSYFKTQAIDYAMNFLTKELGLFKKNLWVSVFNEDKESAEIWHKTQQIPLEKIFLLGEKDNFWRMGETGPCGPCSEIYYYDGNKKNPTPEDMTEVWNLVFMEFNEDHSGRKTPLPKPCIDTGMGLERLTAILQGKSNNYHTDLFKQIIESIEEASGVKYNFTNEAHQDENQIAFRVIADHSRAISFLICDGVLPGSEGDSYVLRRILRRAFFYSHKLKSNKNLLCIATEQVIHLMSEIYPELNKEKTLIDSTIKEEEKLFIESLEIGKNIFLQKIKKLSNKMIPDDLVWNLYNTYGFPPDLTLLIAKEKGFTVNENFNLEQFKQEQISAYEKRITDEGYKEFLNRIDPQHIHSIIGNQETKFTGYKKNKEMGQILLMVSAKSPYPPVIEDGSKFGATTLDLSSPLKKNQTGWLILDKTCFYPEGGGPIGDKGIITTETGKAEVLDCQKQGDLIFHAVKVLKGEIKKNQQCEMEVDKNHRKLIATSHSATHLLNQALREVLGQSVRQMGSFVEPGKLRFDFNYPKPLNPDQLQEIETKVTEQIKSKHSVSDAIYPYEEAVNKGALSLAGENYEKEVRTIHMGKSFELCGGIHVKNTSEIDNFKIISETGVQSGVRRITAYTSDILEKWQKALEKQNKKLREYLNLSIPDTPEPTNLFIQWLINTEKEIKSLKLALTKGSEKPPLINPLKNNGTVKKQTENHSMAYEVELNLELRKYLKLPIPKHSEEIDLKTDFFISFFQKKEQELESLKKQQAQLSSSFNMEETIKKAKSFQYQNINGHLLSVAFPMEDRKILAEIADQLKSKLPDASLVVVVGEGKKQYPLIVVVSKELQKHISAGELLKNTIAPFLVGKGGGQARFAQGTIKNKNLFPKLEDHLLKILNKTT